MKSNDIMLAILIILFLGLAYWIYSTGRFDSVGGSFVNGIWNSIEGIIRPVFRW